SPNDSAHREPAYVFYAFARSSCKLSGGSTSQGDSSGSALDTKSCDRRLKVSCSRWAEENPAKVAPQRVWARCGAFFVTCGQLSLERQPRHRREVRCGNH